MDEKRLPKAPPEERDVVSAAAWADRVRGGDAPRSSSRSASAVAEPPSCDAGLPDADETGREDCPAGGAVGSAEKINFGGGKFRSHGELDMTPMVDVTFLLLIFFMVTAAFSLLRTHELPQPEPDGHGPIGLVPPAERLDFCEVVIDQNGSYFVTGRDAAETEAASEAEMRALVRNVRESHPEIDKLIVTCHVDAKHARAVAAWDAGLAAGYATLQRRTTGEDH